jgi:DNA ligase (NAD+)
MTTTDILRLTQTYLQETAPITTTADAAAQLHDLEAVLHYHEQQYYVHNNPLIADTEYDILYKTLEKIEAAYPQLRSNTSPTLRVGADNTGDFANITHLTPMLSLENTYNLEDLQKFEERVHGYINMDLADPIDYVVEPKFDGGTIVLVYENDVLLSAATRGNGATGDDITLNAKAMRTVPLRANFSQYGIYKIELRGEALIAKSKFAALNEARLRDGAPLLANARNAATGVMRVKDAREVAIRGLEAFVYQVATAEDKTGAPILQPFTTHNESIELLKNLGFKVPTLDFERKLCKNMTEVFEFVTKWEAQRDSYDYEIDGMVVKVNSSRIQAQSGSTSHHPRWAVAFKFKARQASTRLETVDFQVGRTGAITPVAKLQPVQLAGVTVSSVSLHNEEMIKEKDLHYGDMVLVERAGDVIPYIVKALPEYRDGSQQPIIYPTNCPVCDSPLVKPEKEAIWRCDNLDCTAQIVERLIHFVSKDAMNIDGLGRAQIERFYAAGLLSSVLDIYQLDYNKLKTFDGLGAKSVDNLAQAIAKSMQNPAGRLLYALGIRHVGEGTARTVVPEVNKLQDLADWTTEQFIALKDVGPKVAEMLTTYFHEPKHIELLNQLEALGVNTTRTDAEAAATQPTGEGIFSNKTILFTGKLFELTREKAESAAQAMGARVLGAVSKDLDILVVGDKAGSKLAKAQKLGTVQILTELEFIALLKTND